MCFGSDFDFRLKFLYFAADVADAEHEDAIAKANLKTMGSTPLRQAVASVLFFSLLPALMSRSVRCYCCRFASVYDDDIAVCSETMMLR